MNDDGLSGLFNGLKVFFSALSLGTDNGGLRRVLK